MGPYQKSKPTKGRSSLRHIAPSQAQQQPTPRGLHQPPPPLPLLPPSVLRVYLSGCGHGVGLGLDEFNVITEL